MIKIEKIVYWLFTIFLIYLIIELIRKILGGSLGFEELVIALLVGNLGFSFQLWFKLSNIDSKLSEHLGWHRGKLKEN